MNKVLIIWLWWQWQKYVDYFLKHSYTVFWICKTLKTKYKIQKRYGISVENDYNEFLKINTVNIIIIALPPEIQWKIALDTAKKYPATKIIVEIPISWDIQIVEELKKYKNCIFYLEEYFTLLAQFLRQIDISKMKKIDITVSVSQKDHNDRKASKVTHMHIMNNFLWTNIDKKLLNFSYCFHEREDIFYEAHFDYKDTKISYIFNEEKHLIVGNKIYPDKYNFDFVLTNILKHENQMHTVKEKYIESAE